MQPFHHLLRVVALLLVSAALLVGVGCGSSGETVESAEAEEPAPEINPREGMTKEEIATMYQGQPDQKTVNSDGSETWRYHMNAGERWIPWNYGYQPEYHVIHFDTEGRVRSYSLND
ncbi:MAG: hypothetical protein ACODAQ_12345 [Phycisphaeraceae bacterium]